MSRPRKETHNYKSYDTIIVYLEKGTKEAIKAYAKNRGESVSGFVKKLIEKEMNE